MITPEDGIATGEMVAEPREIATWARWAYSGKQLAVAAHRHLAAKHEDWANEAMGSALYIRTLWILRWKGNDSFGSKINKR